MMDAWTKHKLVIYFFELGAFILPVAILMWVKQLALLKFSRLLFRKAYKNLKITYFYILWFQQ